MSDNVGAYKIKCNQDDCIGYMEQFDNGVIACDVCGRIFEISVMNEVGKLCMSAEEIQEVAEAILKEEIHNTPRIGDRCANPSHNLRLIGELARLIKEMSR